MTDREHINIAAQKLDKMILDFLEVFSDDDKISISRWVSANIAAMAFGMQHKDKDADSLFEDIDCYAKHIKEGALQKILIYKKMKLLQGDQK